MAPLTALNTYGSFVDRGAASAALMLKMGDMLNVQTSKGYPRVQLLWIAN